MDKRFLLADRLFSPLTAIYKRFENIIEKISKYVVLPIFLISIGIFVFQKMTTKEVECFEEFALKKEFKSSKYNNLDVYSNAIFDKLAISGAANIYGSLRVDNSTLLDANVYGTLHATGTKFQDINVYGFSVIKNVRLRDAEIYGNLNADRLTVKNGLIIAGSASLESSQINYCELMGSQIILQKTDIKKLKIFNAEHKKATVYLSYSNVDTIEFDKIHGEVFVYDEKSLVKNIKGGTLIKVDKKFPFEGDVQKNQDKKA
jgi:cytoskeletal protein CcmA (bactofilin family)